MKSFKKYFGAYYFINRYWYIWFLIIVPIIFQLLYSRYGFNPTDDGFILAYSRRILNGEIPHIDFISIRPVGSAILHSIIVLIGGDFTLYISRFFVWFQFALIGAASVILAEFFLKQRFNLFIRLSVALLAVLCSLHSFPPMAWHTVDGIFVIMLGALAVISNKQILKYLGYFLIGFSFLCKQNYLPAAILSPFIFSDWKKWKTWLVLFAPAIIYPLPAIVALNFSNYVSQLTTQSDLNQTGLLIFQNSLAFMQKIFVGVIVAITLFWPNLNFKNKKYPLGFIVALVLLIPIFKRSFLQLSDTNYITGSANLIAGIFFGNLLILLSKSSRDKEYVKLFKYGLFIGLLVWCSAISVGYNNTALGSGLLVSFLFIELAYVSNKLGKIIIPDKIIQPLFTVLLIYLTIITSISFNIGREKNVYRDLPSSELGYSLSGVLPGARGILTNKNVYEYYADLDMTINSLGGKKYALLPEDPAFWIKSKDENPLPIDWAYSVELNQQGEDRLAGALDNFVDQGGYIIMEKYYAANLATSLIPMGTKDGQYPIRDYVISKYDKLYDTDFFEVYSKTK